MKTDLLTLKDSFKLGYETFEPSRIEAAKVMDYYHNRQYDNQQLAILANRGQPAETFNVIKLFARMTQGYYATVINTVKVDPVQYSDIPTASLLNDMIGHVMRTNYFDNTGDEIKLDGMLSGLMCTYIDVKDTGVRDHFGRPIRTIELEQVSPEEIVLDPMSSKADYSDARFLHRFKWLTEDQVAELFTAEKVKALQSYSNHLNVDEAEFAYKYGMQFSGHFKVFDNYLIVHTIVKDDAGKSWNIFWSGDTELQRTEITHKDVKSPYRVQKLHTSNKAEYYGIMREVLPAQDAINQALLKIQLMVNTQKAIVQNGAVDDIDEFTDAFNRVNGVLEVNAINGVKIENLTREVLDQYTIIDKAFDRIQRVLGINDSFLGQAFASDSGRKVKLQQNSTIIALRYMTGKFEQFYMLLGWDIVSLIKQYYTANQVVRIVDETVGERWIELNKPEMQWSGEYDTETGEPIMVPVMEEVMDPASGKPLKDAQGNIVIAPIPTLETELADTNIDITLVASAYNDEDEKNQLMLETILSGNIGSILSQANPAGYFTAAGLSVKSMKTKYSAQISNILEQTASMLSPEMQQQMEQGMVPGQQGGQSAKSSELKLPQNTNEGS